MWRILSLRRKAKEISGSKIVFSNPELIKGRLHTSINYLPSDGVDQDSGGESGHLLKISLLA